MNRAIPGRTFFAAAYILLAIGFLTIHFTRVENYSTVVGNMVLKGRSSVGTAATPSQIRHLRIDINGLKLVFRKSDKAVLITDDGIRHPLNVTEWSHTDDTITIGMDNGAGFILYSDPHGTGTTLTPIVPVTVPPVRSLELPLKADGGTVVSQPSDRPETISIAVDDQEYIADLPSDSFWDAEKGRLNLVILGKADPVLAITDDQRGGGLGAAEWYAQQTLPSESAFGQSVEEWLSLARDGWKSRLDAGTGLWLDVNGSPGWDDQIASSILADSVESGQLPSVLQNVISTAGNAPRSIGWLPSPYLGNIVNQTRVRTTELQAVAGNLARANADGNPSFGTPSALGILIDSAYPDEAVKLMDAARNAPAPETPNDFVMDRIALLQEARELSIDDETEDGVRRKGYFDAYILPRILWVKDGLWLVEEDGSINPLLSIRAGELLMKEALWTNDGLYQSVGRQLVISALKYSDENGMIPGRILFEGDGEVVTEGRISPESLYETIVSSRAYPRHVSLANELGSGSWALTAAERFTVRSTPRETTIALDYPAGSIHHLAIRGVKPFNVLYMNGIKWNGDPNFQRYYAGWFYDTGTETLFIKIRHRTKTETIRILYYDPDAAPASETDAVADAS